ncbi:MAG: isopentenyl-diphosphate Delta-isomerase [Gemmatimonadaceae bacterium]
MSSPPPDQEYVILVNSQDESVGTEEKMRAHQRGVLHRAFSIFLVNSDGQILLQLRAATKYHSGGLWSNAACGHPRPGETTDVAAARRLHEEMGIVCELREVDAFVYRAAVTEELTEHEFDHVFLGNWSGSPTPNPEEVESWAWRDAADIDRDLAGSAGQFSAWFSQAWAVASAKL